MWHKTSPCASGAIGSCYHGITYEPPKPSARRRLHHRRPDGRTAPGVCRRRRDRSFPASGGATDQPAHLRAFHRTPRRRDLRRHLGGAEFQDTRPRRHPPPVRRRYEAHRRAQLPRAKFVAQRAEWEMALGMNPRLIASYDQPELRLIRDLGLQSASDGDAEILPGDSVFATGGHSAGHQGVIVQGTDRTLAFIGDLCMRPWSANPKWVTAFDDFPLDSVAVKEDLFSRAAAENWIVALSHEPLRPIGRITRDRGRFSFEAGS